MNGNRKVLAGAIAVIVVVLIIVSMNQALLPQNTDLTDFPDFYTKNEDYYITRINGIPSINRATYRLEITGLVDNPRSFTLEELQALNLTDLPLTIECIGNTKNGKLVGTAIWRLISSN